ncbi:hypothetical protein CFIICLFH_1813 [Methylobacterium goesingense]|nr:hypothetical protein CFIICLFH_1813 [Methylobacterium goesingense]
MACPYRDGLIISSAEARTVTRRSSRSSLRLSSVCRSARWRRAFSVMMTAPSTMRPKSRAPRLMRLALMRPWTMPVMVISIATGMTRAVTMAARMLPSSRNRMTMTRAAPSARFLATVRMVASTRTVRLRTVWTSTPGGRVRRISVIFASTAAATVRLFSPISIRAVPMTTSRPSSLPDPVRRSRPIRTSARSEMRTGTPPRVVTTTEPMSSMVSSRPAARTT